MSGELVNTLPDVQIVACPRCAAELPFSRGYPPHIDDCGFESHRFECRECGTALAGIIDPADETLLLSASAG
jgi:hypothetical protein